MFSTSLCAILSCIVFAGSVYSTRAVVNEEGRLIEHLLTSYMERGSGLARPLENSSHILPIMIKFIVTEFVSLEDSSMTMMVSGVVRAEWNDTYLTWNPADFGGIEMTPLQSNNIYLPVIMRSSSAAELSPLFARDSNTQSMIWVDYRGTVHAAVAGVFTTDCQMDLHDFPFDRQTCDYVFQVWQHSDKQVVLELNPFEPFRLEAETSGSQALWIIEQMLVESRLVPLELANFSAVAYTIQVRRRASFYTFSLIVPCVLMSAVILAIFFMPYRGQRVVFAITLVWTMRLFQQSIAAKVPVTNEPIQILKFTTSQMVLGILATIESVVLVYWLDADKQNDIPHWLIQFHAFSRRVTMWLCWWIPSEDEEVERAQREEEKQQQLVQKKLENLGTQRPMSRASSALYSLSSMFQAPMQDNRDDKNLDKFTRRLRKERRDNNWYDCVVVLDRCAFLISLAVTIAFATAYI